MVAVFLMQI